MDAHLPLKHALQRGLVLLQVARLPRGPGRPRRTAHTKKPRRVLAASRVNTATPFQRVMMGRQPVCVSGCELFALVCNHRLSISANYAVAL